MAAETTSVSFDRAASTYDQTRRFVAEVAVAETQLLTRELAAAGRVVEVGAGTGRVAIPLAGAGIPVFGADLSALMLRRLVEKAPGAVPVVVADAVRLPLADGAFGGAVVAHLLHLVPAWERVLVELVRVLRPGGRLLVNASAFGGVTREIKDHVMAAADQTRNYVGMDLENTDLDAQFAGKGLTPRPLPEIPNPATQTAAEWLDRIAGQWPSFTWRIDPGTLRRATAETREWFNSTYSDPETVVLPSPPVRWQCYELPR